MGRHIRDERQRTALTGLSQAHCDQRCSVCSDIDQATQQKTADTGSESGTRRRTPGGGGTGTLPTRAAPLLFVLYAYKTAPPFEVLGTQWEMARSKAPENLPPLSPLLSDPLVARERRP